MPTAASALATANPMPSVPAMTKNWVGSISGEAIQNAMTGANGTPAANSPATSGITPHEQNGVSPPTNARAISASLPVALAPAANSTESANHGASPRSSAAT